MPDAQLIRCPACGSINRVPVAKIAQGLEPVCGKCKSPLPVKQTVMVTDATFAEEVERSALPVLVDMWAEWCGPCHMIAPALDQLAQEMAGRVRIAKVNIDHNPMLASRFKIQSIPALIVMNNGQEVDRIVGAQPKSEIARRLEKWIA